MSLTSSPSAEWRFALMILALHSPSFGRPITTAAIEGGTVDRAAIDLWAVAVVGVAARSTAVTAAGVIKRKFRATASLPVGEGERDKRGVESVG